MTVVPLETSPNRLTRGAYERERAEIRTAYGNSSGEAGAKRDQALAKLFYRSGWTQEELAEVEGKPRRYLARKLKFGQFLEFIENGPMGPNSDIAVFKLTERKFRGYWERTEKGNGNERKRFQVVIDLMADSAVHAKPRGYVKSQIMDKFADGKWHLVGTIARKLDADEGLVEDSLKRLCEPSSQTAARAEKRKVGTHLEYRVFRKQQVVGQTEAETKLRPIIDQLQAQASQTAGTMSNAAISHAAHELRLWLDKWGKS